MQKSRVLRVAYALLVAMLLAPCAGRTAAAAPSPSNEIVIAAGAVGIREVFERVRKPFEAETGLKISYYTSKEGKELTAVQVLSLIDEGAVDGGLASGYWKALLELMEEKKYVWKHRTAELKYRILAHDSLLILTDQAGPKKLTKPQIQGLLTGEITNWKSITGEDLPVRLNLYAAQLGITIKILKDHFLDGKPVNVAGAAVAPSSQKMLELIGATKGSVGIGSRDMVKDLIKAPEQPSITRPLTFVTLGIPSPKVLKLLDFVRDHGKEYGVPLAD